jgi:hypothetical protein
VLVLLLCVKCNAFLLLQQQGRNRVVFTLRDAISCGDGVSLFLVPILGPPKYCAVSLRPRHINTKCLKLPPEYAIYLFLIVMYTAITFVNIINWSVFVMQANCVPCQVRIQVLYIT